VSEVQFVTVSPVTPYLEPPIQQLVGALDDGGNIYFAVVLNVAS
jgi:hypothetical protein